MTALDGVDLAVDAPEILGVVGILGVADPNGTGKATPIEMLLDLLVRRRR